MAANRSGTGEQVTDRRQPAEGVTLTREQIENIQRHIRSGGRATADEANALCDLALRGLQGPSALEIRTANSILENGGTHDETMLARAILRWEG